MRLPTSELLILLADQLIEPLVVVDVGARWGIGDRWAALGDGVRVFGFDPDVAECDRLNAGKPQGVEYIPLALGSTAGEQLLHVTREPACSSFYAPSKRVAATHPELSCIEVTHTSSVMTSTLEAWCAERHIARIDAIKLDTQGSELDVLLGAHSLLENVQLLEVEVEFNPIYEGQPLFGDVDRFVRANGFALWRLTNQVHYSSADLPGASLDVQDVRHFDSVPFPSPGGSGQLYWGHAYSVRMELTPIGQPGLPWDQAVRAACAALAFELPDFALVALHRAASTQLQWDVLRTLRTKLGVKG